MEWHSAAENFWKCWTGVYIKTSGYAMNCSSDRGKLAHPCVRGDSRSFLFCLFLICTEFGFCGKAWPFYIENNNFKWRTPSRRVNKNECQYSRTLTIFGYELPQADHARPENNEIASKMRNLRRYPALPICYGLFGLYKWRKSKITSKPRKSGKSIIEVSIWNHFLKL